MALYQQPLDFVVMPAEQRHVLPVLTQLLKSSGGILIITGVAPGLEDSVISMLPKSWNSAVIGREDSDGTFTVGSITARQPLSTFKNISAVLRGSVSSAFRHIKAGVDCFWTVARQRLQHKIRRVVTRDT